MNRITSSTLLVTILLAGSATAEPAEPAPQDSNPLFEAVSLRSDGALVEERTALEQEKAKASGGDGFNVELRPSISESDAEVSLRISLPSQWSLNSLHEQLTLAAESEQLRIDALEWNTVAGLYRDFCHYRKLCKQLDLYDQEIRFVEPFLSQADQRVDLNQLTVDSRARIYSTYLDLLNSSSKHQSELISLTQSLHLVIGPDANLDALAEQAVVAMPSVLEIDALLQTALTRRPDMRRLSIDLRATELAEKTAGRDDKFRLRFIQPSYSRDLDTDEETWQVSAAFTLPWASRNPDLSVYRRQRILQQALMTHQQSLIKDRLSVLLNTARARQELAEQQKRRAGPAVEQLKADLKQMGSLPLEYLRDQLSIRERIFDSALQAADSECQAELIAVDLIEELGTLHP